MFSVIWAEKVVPPSKHEAKRILAVEIRGNIKPKTQDHVVIKTLSGDTQRITYARTFDESTGVMSNITIEEFRNEKLTRVQTAKKATWENDSWVLEDGSIFTVDDEDGVTGRAAFSKQVIPLNITPREINWEQKSINEMTLGELRGYVKVLERQKLPTSDLWTEIYMRFAIPLASFVFALLGAPLGTQRLCCLTSSALLSVSLCLRGQTIDTGFPTIKSNFTIVLKTCLLSSCRIFLHEESRFKII